MINFHPVTPSPMTRPFIVVTHYRATGIPGAGEGTTCTVGTAYTVRWQTSKPTPRIHLLQQGHTLSSFQTVHQLGRPCGGHSHSNHCRCYAYLLDECGQPRKNRDSLRIAESLENILQSLTIVNLKEEPVEAARGCFARALHPDDLAM